MGAPSAKSPVEMGEGSRERERERERGRERERESAQAQTVASRVCGKGGCEVRGIV